MVDRTKIKNVKSCKIWHVKSFAQRARNSTMKLYIVNVHVTVGNETSNSNSDDGSNAIVRMKCW